MEGMIRGREGREGGREGGRDLPRRAVPLFAVGHAAVAVGSVGEVGTSDEDVFSS